MILKILYWLTTVLIAFAFALGGYFDLAQPEEVTQGAAKLGYPLYFFSILGFWKLGAVVALLAPKLPRLKEWAYAGIFFDLTGASATHVFMKDSNQDILIPLAILAIAIGSWALRPASRKLPGPAV